MSVEPIAVIGIGCRFPLADNPHHYWQLLHSGVDAISEIPSDRWDVSLFYNAVPATPGKMNTKWGGFLKEVDGFDAEFFSISPREAEYIDPQQRLLLEVGWEALENAEIVPGKLAESKTGVFVGISTNDYGRLSLQDISKISAYTGTGNTFCIAANRLSYLLNLKGPSLAIDTACSSSLVAVHYACQSLRLHESDLCLAGGVNLILSPELTVNFSQARMMASDGRCKTFDAKADGYVRGEGCGIVVLKRLSDALKDKNKIYAVIKGSAVNQDGLTNGLTAPNGPSQQAVISQALKNAGVEANQISYVEAHGTGTPLGDPQEFNSLKRVLSEGRQKDQRCWIGSVKTNIGHLESAAGVASLIKVILSLQNQEIPPHLHFEQLNPYISLKGTPFAIPVESTPWKLTSEKRLAGISGFGFGGTNCHIILEEAPPTLQSEKNQDLSIDKPYHLLTLSAKTEPALLEMASRYQGYLASNPDLSVADVCYSANIGRSQFDHKLAVIADSQEQLQKHLQNFTEGKEDPNYIQGKFSQRQIPKIAFLFTGQGSQYVRMGRQLYETQPVFRAVLDQCDEILRSHLSQPLLKILYGEDADLSLINQTAYTQPALFAIEYALFKLWQSWGINPDVVMGHSVGEYTAACVAGVFSLRDGLKLIAHRGRLMQELPSGGNMVALMTSAEQISEIVKPYDSKVSLAAVNGPQNVVISGEEAAITEICQQLENQEIKTKQLQVSHAFHSPLMEPMLVEFAKVAEEITYNLPEIPIVSNVTGQQADETIATANYWVSHVRETVRFAQSMETLNQQNCRIFLEIGPKPILLGMGRQCLPEDGQIWLPSLRPNQPDWQQILTSLGQLYVQGAKIDWSEFEKDYHHQKVVLPTYPFQRQHYWLETGKQQTQNPDPVSLTKANTPIMELLSQGDTQKLAQQIQKVGNLSQTEIKFLPKLLDLLIQQNQQQLKSATIQDWLYEVEWRLQPLFNNSLLPNFLLKPGEIEKKTSFSIPELAEEVNLSSYGNILAQLEKLSVEYLVEALTQIGWNYQPGQKLEFSSLSQNLGIVPNHQRLFKRLLEILEEVEILQKTQKQWQVTKALPYANSEEKSQALLNQYPTAQAELTLLHRCASKLAAVLQGRIDPVQLVFPEGDFNTATKLYQESPVARVMNTLVQQAITTALEHLPLGQGVRLLEIGAGTGGTTSYILPHLNPSQTKYVFTDISPLFLSKAQEKFRDNHFVNYQILDIEQDPTKQGFNPHQYDVIIAANVLHATAYLNKTLSHVQQLLAPGGTLILLEVTTSQRWLDLIFGLLEGWWKVDDVEIRPDYPLLSTEKWEQLLQSNGFSEVATLPKIKETSSPLSKQAVIIAQAESNLISKTPFKSGGWLILADKEGVGEQLASYLQSQGEVCKLVFTGDKYQQLASEEFTLNPNKPEEFEQLMKQIKVQLPVLSGIVQCWSLKLEIAQNLSSDDLEQLSHLGCGTTLSLIQALVKAELTQPPSLWLVTQGAQPVPSHDPVISGITQSSIWGMGKVISLEHPELNCVRIDLDPNQKVDQQGKALFSEIWSDNKEDQVAWRGDSRYVARLIKSQHTQAEKPLKFREDGTYVITGGWGGLGLLVADWLAKNGAKHLVLVGRSTPSDTAMSQIRKLEQAGVEIVIAQADIVQTDSISTVFSRIKQDLLPLRGIIHSAAVVDDALIAQYSWQQFSKALAPKVQGTWNLHNLSKNQPIDFFVLFSSAASLLGGIGLGSYASANSFQDAMAYYRHSMNLPSITVNWGAIAEIGLEEKFKTTEKAKNKDKETGVSSIPPKRALETLDLLMKTDAVEVGVIPIDWSLGLPQHLNSPFVAEFQAVLEKSLEPNKSAVTSYLTIWEQLQETPRGNHPDILATYLQEPIAKILGINSSSLTKQISLTSLGFDSLMAIELRNRIKTELNVDIPVSEFMAGKNILEIARYLEKKLSSSAINTRIEKIDQKTTETLTEEEILENLDQLSDSDIDSLLSKMLAETEESADE